MLGGSHTKFYSLALVLKKMSTAKLTEDKSFFNWGNVRKLIAKQTALNDGLSKGKSPEIPALKYEWTS